MPAAMGIVWEIVRNEHKSKQFAELLLKFDKVSLKKTLPTLPPVS